MNYALARIIIRRSIARRGITRRPGWHRRKRRQALPDFSAAHCKIIIANVFLRHAAYRREQRADHHCRLPDMTESILDHHIALHQDVVITRVGLRLPHVRLGGVIPAHNE